MKKITAFSLCLLFSFPVYAQKWAVTKPSITTDYYVLDSKRIPMNSSGSKGAVIPRPTPMNSSYSIPVSGTQAINQSIVIEAIDRSSTVKGRFLWADYQIRQGLKSFTRLTRITPQSLVIGSIVGYALEQGYDWIVGDDGKIYQETTGGVVYLNEVYPETEIPPPYPVWVNTTYPAGSNKAPTYFTDGLASCDYWAYVTGKIDRTYTSFSSQLSGGVERLICHGTRLSLGVERPVTDYAHNRLINPTSSCPSGYQNSTLGCFYTSTGSVNPVPYTEIDTVIDQMDKDNLDINSFDELMKSATLPSPDSFIIDSFDPNVILANPVVSTSTDTTTGSIYKTSVQDEYKFDFENINDNAVITGSTVTVKNEYKDDVLINNTVITDAGTTVTGDTAASTPSQPPIELEWLCGIEDTPECRVAVNDTGFQDLEPLENSQDLIDDYVQDVLDDLPTGGSDNNSWGFSMDVFMPNFSSITGTCQNPNLSLFGTPVDVDICDLASKVKPLLNFLVYFLIVFNFRRLFLSIPKKVS